MARKNNKRRKRANKVRKPAIPRTYPGPPLDLETEEIRILRLYPGEFEDYIRCRLENVVPSEPTRRYKSSRSYRSEYQEAYDCRHWTLQHCCDCDPSHSQHGNFTPKCSCYEALSYTWGSTTKRRSIFVSSLADEAQGYQDFRVTRNLFAALRRMRHPKDIRTLWIDAICINQSDLRERGHQVSFMGKVYAYSRRVLVWLGDDSDDCRIPEMIDETSDGLPGVRYDYTSPAESYEDPTRAPSEEWTFSKLLHIAALRTTILRTRPPWWTRAWVAQEFALCPVEPLFLFSRFQSSRAKLNDLTMSFNIGQYPGLDRDDVTTQTTAPIANALHKLLQTTLSLSASDSRDRVYSILGLLPSDYDGLLKPDYSEDIWKVFADATYADIYATTRLTILALVTFIGDPFTASSPSWAIAPKGFPLNQLVPVLEPDYPVDEPRWFSHAVIDAPRRLSAKKICVACRIIDRVHFMVPFRVSANQLHKSRQVVDGFVSRRRLRLTTCDPYWA